MSYQSLLAVRLPLAGGLLKLSARWTTLSLLIGAVAARAAEPASCTGITEPVVDVTLSLPVPGIVTRLKVKEGDFVQTNDLILELDSRLEEIEVDRRQSILDNHKADWESTRMVFEKSSSVSRDELLKKESDYKVALAEYEEAAEQLRRRRLFAPAAGVITEIKLHQGEACAPYEPIVRLVDTRRCYFLSNLEVGTAVQMKPGQKVELQIEDVAAPLKVPAQIIFVSPVVDSASGLQKFKAVFDNTNGVVRPGLAGKILLGGLAP
jgi:RND family efflux transporter MFP subunit